MHDMLRFSFSAAACWLACGCHAIVGFDDIEANPGNPNTSASRHVWSFALDGSEDELSAGIALLPGSSNLVWGGTSYGQVEGTPPYQGNGDALVMHYDSANVLQRAGRYGDGDSQSVAAVAAISGRIVVVGTFAGNIDLSDDASDPHASNGQNDIFVAAFDAGGSLSWARTFGGPGAETATGIAIDPTGAVVVVGSYWLAIPFDAYVLETTANAPRAFVARLDGSNGDVLKAVDFPMALDSSASEALGVAVDGESNVAVVGTFAGGMDFESPCSALQSGGSSDFDGFVVQLDPDLICTASKSLATDLDDRLQAVAGQADASGLVVAGRAGASFDMECGARVGEQSSGNQLVLARFDDYLQCEWQAGYAVGADSDALGLAVATTGAIVVGGRFGDSVDFGGGALSAHGGHAAFLASLTHQGSHTWSMAIGGNARISGVAIDGDEEVVVTGDSNVATSWGGDTIGNHGGFDAVIAKYKL